MKILTLLLFGLAFFIGYVTSFGEFLESPFAPYFFNQHMGPNHGRPPPPKRTPEMCLQYPDSGNCTKYTTKYYFNKTTGMCEPFAFGSCPGNHNNNRNRFRSKIECMSTCYCSQPRCFLKPLTGPCKANKKMFYYDPMKGMCQPFTYGGCQGNANRFATEVECSHTCQCSACVHTYGHCSGYHFNHAAEKCVHLPQSHCTSQPNVFDTRDQCNKQCSICNLPKDPGPCNAPFFHNHFYYDSATKMCKPFYYGGCGGNKNRFWFEEQCQMTCGGGVPYDAERPESVSPRRRGGRVRT